MRPLAAAVAVTILSPLATVAATAPSSAQPGYAVTFPSCNAATQVKAGQTGERIAGGTPKPQSTATPNAIAQTGDGLAVNKTVIGGKALEQAHEGTYEAIKGVPGVQDTQTRASSGADSLQIRGIKLNNSANYRMDGALTLNNQINLPTEDKCRIEALKGAGALEFGIASPAGIVNYVLKRATDTPVASLGFVGNEFGQAIGSADVGRKFGSHNQFGLRMNLASGAMGSVAKGAGGTRYVGALTGDWYLGDRAAFQFDYEQLGIDLVEQASLNLNKGVNGRIALPDPKRINPTNLLSGPWAISRGWEQNMVARFGYALAPNTTFIVQTGRSEANRPMRDVSQIGNYNVKTGVGTDTVTFVQNQDYINDFYSFQIKTRTDHPWLSNELTLGFDHNQRWFNNPQNPKITLTQNIYNPVTLPPQYSPTSTRNYVPNLSYDSDPYFMDAVSLRNRLRVIGGVRQIGYTSNDQTANGKPKTETSSTLAPAAAVIYDIRPNVSAYASYVESLEETGQAPATAANAYAVLPPAKAQQKEVGIRASNLGRFSPTLAYFRINEANATTDPVTNIFALNGTITYEGLEWTNTTRISRRFSLDTGGIYMRGIQHSQDRTINGRPPENMPNLNYSIGFSYDLPFAPGLTLTAGRRYTGWRQADPANQAQLPGVSVANLGLRYATKINGRKFEMGVNATNLLDKRYLSSSINGNLGVGAPRSITFTTRYDVGP